MRGAGENGGWGVGGQDVEGRGGEKVVNITHRDSPVDAILRQGDAYAQTNSLRRGVAAAAARSCRLRAQKNRSQDEPKNDKPTHFKTNKKKHFATVQNIPLQFQPEKFS